jgi:uncharacterized protein
MPERNLANWFDIPVENIDRAVKFYETLLEADLERYSAPGLVGALLPSRGVTGTLLKADGFVPSTHGSVIYLNGDGRLDQMLARAERAGGRTLVPRTEIQGGRGYFAYFEDCEGNRIGIHSSD